MDKELYLTDKQYIEILLKIRETITQDNFQPDCSDCTVVGWKPTDSNCGFCNDLYADKDMDVFPKQHPIRRTMKYRRKNHRCPFDTRKKPGILGWGYGCFFECYLFKHLSKRNWSLAQMRKMVNHTIKEATNG